jgi:hypothetical protein
MKCFVEKRSGCGAADLAAQAASRLPVGIALDLAISPRVSAEQK